jgi:hypothetical protein
MTRSLIAASSNNGFTVSLREFANGLADFGVTLEEGEVKKLFKYLD